MRSATLVSGGSEPGIDPRAESPDRALRRGIGLLLLYILFLVAGAAVFWWAGGVRGWTLGVLITLRILCLLPQLVHALPSLRRVRDRYWHWTFGAQVLLGFGPHLLFGAQWSAGGFTAASALLLFPAPLSWVVVALVMVAEGAFQLAYGTSLGWTISLVVDGVLVIALATYVLARLIDVLAELRDTRQATAQAVIGQERLRAAREVFGRLGPRLSATTRTADRARRIAGTDPAAASASTVELGQLARRALGDVREAARMFREADGPAAAANERGVAVTTSTEPRLAFVVIVVMSFTGALANVVGIFVNQQPGPAAAVAAVAGMAALVGLQIYHAAPRVAGDARPRGWRWTLPLQILLVYLPVPVFGLDWIGMSCYLAGCVLVVLRRPASWLVFAVIMATTPPILVALYDRNWYLPYPLSGYIAYTMLATVWTVVIFRTPMLLAGAIVRLRAARAELIRMMLVRERLAVARDVHDLLGSSLSAVALKADLAQRLLPRDPGRAGAELADAADLAHRALAEARALSGDLPDTSLARELASARSMLAAASIRADIIPCPDGLPTPADTALAFVVREAITNVLRHSAAQQCTISFSLSDGTARLRIVNDGASAPRNGSGTGIDNLSARVHALGGHLRATPHGEQGFSLHAEVPISGVEQGEQVTRSALP